MEQFVHQHMLTSSWTILKENLFTHYLPIFRRTFSKLLNIRWQYIFLSGQVARTSY